MPDREPPENDPTRNESRAASNGSGQAPHEQDLDALAEQFHRGDETKAESNRSGARAFAVPLLDAHDEGDADLPLLADAPLDADGFSASELRRTSLGQRLARRRGYSIAAQEPKTRRLFSSWGIGGVLLLSLWSLYGTWPDLRYWLSGQPPIDLGHLGGYHLEGARDGLFAHVEGVASPKRGTYSRMFGEHELFPLIASRVLVDRARPPDESMRGFGFNYSGEGRLVRVEEGSKWDAVRSQFVQAGELAHAGDIWLLEEGVSPHRGFSTPAQVIGWSLACLVCAFVLARRARKSVVAIE